MIRRDRGKSVGEALFDITPGTSVQHLRVLIANERQDRLKTLARVIKGLGHEVVASETLVEEVGPATARERPDVAFVGLGEDPQHALDLVSCIVREAFCPVIAVTHAHDPDWVNEVAKRGVYAYIVEGRPDQIQSAIEITLRRYAEHQALQGAFDRRDAEALKEQKSVQLRQRHALELHDRIVQGLSVALLALQLDQRDSSEAALATTLAEAKTIVARAIEELRASGMPHEELLRVAAGHA
jgi:response regulator NasT